jgi:hypothetical protein
MLLKKFMMERAPDGSSVALFHCPLKFKQTQNPGVASPDGAILFYWPKRVCRKGPTLRWACLARQDGNFNSDRMIGHNAYVSPAGLEALVSLSCCGDF